MKEGERIYFLGKVKKKVNIDVISITEVLKSIFNIFLHLPLSFYQISENCICRDYLNRSIYKICAISQPSTMELIFKIIPSA